MGANYPQGPAYQPQYAPPAKKSNVLLWVLLVIGGVILLCVLAVAGAGYFFFQKAKQAGLDTDLLKRNPQLAAVKIAAAMNHDLEIVSYDESKNTVTVKNKATGETTTISFDDAKNGRWGVQNGQEPATVGSKAPLKTPSWLPRYPGAVLTGTFSADGGDGSAGSVKFSTDDSVEQVAKFYEREFRSLDMKVTKSMTSGDGGAGGMVSGQVDDRSAVAVIASEGNKTTVSLTFRSGKE